MGICMSGIIGVILACEDMFESSIAERGERGDVWFCHDRVSLAVAMAVDHATYAGVGYQELQEGLIGQMTGHDDGIAQVNEC